MRSRLPEMTIVSLSQYANDLNESTYVKARSRGGKRNQLLALRKLENALVVGNWLFNAICLIERNWRQDILAGKTDYDLMEAKAFVGHLLGLWYDPFEHLLDYTSGRGCSTGDQPGQFDRNGLDEPQDVVEYWAVDWSKHGKYHEPPHRAGSGLGLSVAWYRDVLGASWYRSACRDGSCWSTRKDRVAGRLLSLRVKRVNRGSA